MEHEGENENRTRMTKAMLIRFIERNHSARMDLPHSLRAFKKLYTDLYSTLFCNRTQRIFSDTSLHLQRQAADGFHKVGTVAGR